MKNLLLKLVTVILAVLMITGLTVGCGNKADTDNRPEAEDTQAEQVETTAEAKELTADDIIRERYASNDYGGKEMRILSPSIGKHFYYQLGNEVNEIWAETETGDVMNDAIIKRNRNTEELLNVKITPIWGGDTDAITKTIQKAVTAGSDEFDAVINRMDFFGTPMTSGYLMNLLTVNSINTEDYWWDSNITSNFTLFKSKLYWIAGDINTFDDYAVEAIYFNKKLCDDHSLKYPYQTVLEGKWTIDKFNEMAQTVVKDINGDGVIKVEDDVVGHIENNDHLKHWIYAMGEKSIDIDEDGILTVNTLNERQVLAVDTLYHYMVEAEMTYSGYEEIFMEDKALFMGNMLGPINKLRGMDSDFGLIPMPKLDEAQENYGEYVSNGWTTAIAIPITCPDPEFTGIVLDTMCAFSNTTVRYALYDIMLNVKLVRDDESLQTLDVILASKAYDWAVDFSWGSTFQTAYNNVYNTKKNKYVSTATKSFDKQSKTINDLLDTIRALP